MVSPLEYWTLNTHTGSALLKICVIVLYVLCTYGRVFLIPIPNLSFPYKLNHE